MTRDPNEWKDKYLSALDDLEAKEKAWEQIEKTLRQALSRLSLAVDTHDRQLKAELESLRQAIRKEVSVAEISRRMADISASVIRLDQTAGAGAHQGAILARCEAKLRGLRVPGDMRAQLRELRHRLRDAAVEQDLAAGLEALTGYVETLTAAASADAEAAPGGLLGRWFGGKTPSGADASAAASAVAADDGRDADADADLDDALDDAARRERAAAAGMVGDPERERAAASSRAVTRLDEAADPAAGVAGDALPAFNQVLFDLLHRLDLPPVLAEQSEALAALLREPPSLSTARRAVSELADLMAKARSHVEREKRDIETFLAELTERLQQLDAYLESAVGHSEEAFEQGDVFDRRVSDEVAGIRRSVTEAEDLTQLKGVIQSHLDNIQLHMDTRRRLEADRLRRAETEVTQLQGELSKVQEESHDLRIRLNEARNRALHDPLTGLSNRLAYEERMAQECDRWRRYGRPLVLSIWDVDHFKRINDEYGHVAGDNVLKILGSLLRKHTRKTDFVARFGGEEFMMLLPETDIATAFEVADKLRTLIAGSKFMYHGQPVPVTLSCGLAEMSGDDTPETIYRRADTALYEAKHGGRNRCAVYGEAVRQVG